MLPLYLSAGIFQSMTGAKLDKRIADAALELGRKGKRNTTEEAAPDTDQRTLREMRGDRGGGSEGLIGAKTQNRLLLELVFEKGIDKLEGVREAFEALERLVAGAATGQLREAGSKGMFLSINLESPLFADAFERLREEMRKAGHGNEAGVRKTNGK